MNESGAGMRGEISTQVRSLAAQLKAIGWNSKEIIQRCLPYSGQVN
jgi:hypothetical protein